MTLLVSMTMLNSFHTSSQCVRHDRFDSIIYAINNEVENITKESINIFRS